MIQGVPCQCNRAAISPHRNAARVCVRTLALISGCEARLAVDVRRGSSSHLTGEGAVRRNEQPVRAPRNRLEEFLEDEILQKIGGPDNLNLIEHEGSSLHHRRNRVRELRAHHPQQDRGPDTDREGTDRLRIALKRSFGHSADGLLLHMRCRRCRRVLLHFAQQASRLPFSFPPEFAFSGSFSNRLSGRQIAGTPAMTLGEALVALVRQTVVLRTGATPSILAGSGLEFCTQRRTTPIVSEYSIAYPVHPRVAGGPHFPSLSFGLRWLVRRTLRAVFNRGFACDDVGQPAGLGEDDERRLLELHVPEAEVLARCCPDRVPRMLWIEMN